MIEASATTKAAARQHLPTDTRIQAGLAFAAFILIGGSDAAVGVLLPSMRSFYSIDKATIGLLFAAGTCGYLTSAFSSGPLVGKLGIRVFMMLGLSALAMAAFVISFTPPFEVLMGAFALAGFGSGLIDAGLNSHIAGLPSNTVLLNVLHAFYGVGALLGPLLATAVLASAFQWNTLYYAWVALGAALVIGFGMAFKGYRPKGHAEEHQEGEKQRNVLASALRLRVVWIAACFLLVYVGIEVSMASWSFSFLTEERHQTLALAGLAVSGQWLGLTVGRLVLGKVGERIGNRRLIQFCLVGVVAGVLLIWLVPIGWVMLAGFWLVGFSLAPIFPTTIAMMSGLVAARVLPGVIGFMASFGSMGAALMPAAIGALAEHLGLWVLMPWVITLSVLLLGLWFVLQKQRR
jgi:fucose permease